MRIVGLTGSIGMGKTTTAGLFRAQGVPVHDADAAVHRLYQNRAVEPVAAAFPDVVTDGKIDRSRLADRVLNDPERLSRLEAIVHPLVAEEEAAFLRRVADRGYRLAILDIPLLFESGGWARVDAILVVSAAPEIQKARVLARPGMTEGKFSAIMARQMPDSEKRRRAHFLVDTGAGLPSAARRVQATLRALAFAP